MGAAKTDSQRRRGRTIPSTCWECSTTCGALLTVDEGRVIDIRPNRAHPWSQGAFCAKGIRALPEWTYSENRLLHPLKRRGPRGGGEWERCDWEEAIEITADGLARVGEEHGPMALAAAVSGAFFSRGAVVALLMRAIGSPNWMINQDLCGGCRGVSDRVTGLGITGGEDIERTRCALLVGRNPYAADPVQWRALKRAQQRGGRLIVIDPNRTSAADRADLWLRPRPGTDAAVALGMINVIITEKRFDEAFVSRWCRGFEALAARAAPYTPQRVAELSDVPALDLVAAAREFATGPSVFVSGHGIDAFTAGFQTFRAFHCLVAICGHLDVPGGNRRSKRPPGLRTFLDLVHDLEFQLPAEIAGRGLGADRYPLWTGPDGWQTACHNPTVIDAVLTGHPYPVRGMYVSGVNVVVTYPDAHRTVEAFKSLDFLAVAGHAMNPTSAWADVVLPKTTTLEEEEVQLQPGGPCVSYTQPAHPPLGEARPDIEIASALLDALGDRLPVNRALLPWGTQREMNEFLLGDSGITIEHLAERGFAQFDYRLGDFEAEGFATPSGKIELWSETLERLGHDPLPDHATPRIEREPSELRERFPLILLTGEREKNYHHSCFRDQLWLRRQSPDPRLRMHPATAAALEVGDDCWVAVETPEGRGHCQARVLVTDRVLPGVVSTGMGWWRPEAEGPDYDASTVNINTAVSYSGPYDPVTGSPDSRGLPCRVSPL